jgi:uncharacterized protein DUF4304
MGAAQAPGVAQFFTDFATPVLAAHGFSRKGRTYRHRADGGDLAVVEFQASSGSTPQRYLCYINLAVVTAAWLDWITQGKPPAEPGSAYGLYRTRLLRPGTGDDLWSIDSPDTARQRGQELAEVLPARLSELVRLLDRDEFRHRVRSDPALSARQSELVMEIALLVDDGPSRALDDALARMPRAGSGAAFVDWARRRAVAATATAT